MEEIEAQPWRTATAHAAAALEIVQTQADGISSAYRQLDRHLARHGPQAMASLWVSWGEMVANCFVWDGDRAIGYEQGPGPSVTALAWQVVVACQQGRYRDVADLYAQVAAADADVGMAVCGVLVSMASSCAPLQETG